MKWITASLLALTLLPGSANAQERERSPNVYKGSFDPQVRGAVDRALAFLVARQNANGSWTNRVGYKLYDDYYGEEGDSTDVTALACMALVSAGNVPGRGRYGKAVEKGIDFLLGCVRDEDGYITKNGSRMYSHAFATLFLAEIYGTTRRTDVKAKLKRAIQMLVSYKTGKEVGDTNPFQSTQISPLPSPLSRHSGRPETWGFPFPSGRLKPQNGM